MSNPESAPNIENKLIPKSLAMRSVYEIATKYSEKVYLYPKNQNPETMPASQERDNTIWATELVKGTQQKYKDLDNREKALEYVKKTVASINKELGLYAKEREDTAQYNAADYRYISSQLNMILETFNNLSVELSFPSSVYGDIELIVLRLESSI